MIFQASYNKHKGEIRTKLISITKLLRKFQFVNWLEALEVVPVKLFTEMVTQFSKWLHSLAITPRGLILLVWNFRIQQNT